MPRKAAAAAKQAKRTPDKPVNGPQHYRADTYHEIETGAGVLRVEAGDYVVTGADGSISVMPPSRFEEAFAKAGD